MKRRALLGGVSLLSLSNLLQGCTRPATPLRIAIHHWPGYEFIFLAQREGWISPQDSVLVEAGSATDSMQLMTSGKADAAALTLDEVLRLREQGLALQVVLVFDISMGADVLLGKPGVETLAQLKGRRVGFEESALGALMLQEALRAARLKLADVTPVRVNVDRHLQAWQDAEVDALITFEPVASQLLAQDAHRLFDTSSIPDTVFDVLAVLPAAVDRHHEAVQALVAAHFRGLSDLRKNPHDMSYRLADSLKLSPSEVRGAFRGLELPNESRNRKLLQGPDPTIVKTVRTLEAIMLGSGILKRRQVDFSDLVNASFLPQEVTP